MSKFTDRLKRMHSSRVRALAEEDGPSAPRVFHANDVESKPEPQDSAEERPVTEERSAEREAVRSKLEFAQRIGRTPKKLKMKRESSSRRDEERFDSRGCSGLAARGESRGTPGREENSVGERLTILRIQAQALVEAGRTEAALPLLHEMLALSPTHTFALTELGRYHRELGEVEIAQLYEARLRAVAPY